MFFSRLALLLALINGAALMENDSGNVALRKLSHGSPSWPRVKGFFVFSQACISGITRNNQTQVHIFWCYLSEVPVEWNDASREQDPPQTHTNTHTHSVDFSCVWLALTLSEFLAPTSQR